MPEGKISGVPLIHHPARAWFVVSMKKRKPGKRSHGARREDGLAQASGSKPKGRSGPRTVDVEGFEQWAETTLGLRRTPPAGGVKRVASPGSGLGAWFNGNEIFRKLFSGLRGGHIQKGSCIPVAFSDVNWRIDLRARKPVVLPIKVRRLIILPRAGGAERKAGKLPILRYAGEAHCRP
jgi:hypothetical protein